MLNAEKDNHFMRADRQSIAGNQHHHHQLGSRSNFKTKETGDSSSKGGPNMYRRNNNNGGVNDLDSSFTSYGSFNPNLDSGIRGPHDGLFTPNLQMGGNQDD